MFFFFNDTATTEIYTLSLHDALPISGAEEGGDAGLRLVLPDFAELLWGAVGFALLYLILRKFVFPSLGKMLDERSAKIQGQMEQAEVERQKADDLRRQYESQLADARSQGNTIRSEERRVGKEC